MKFFLGVVALLCASVLGWGPMTASAAGQTAGQTAGGPGYGNESVGVIPGVDPLQRTRQRAAKQLVKSVRSDDPFVRANAIEASLNLPNMSDDMRLTPMLQLALSDRAEVVRFAAAATVARGEIKAMIPSIRPLVEDRSANVRAAALVALYRCGESVDLTPIASMLTSQNASWRANAALMMGLSGDVSAIPMLTDVGEVGLPIGVSQVQGLLSRLQLAEARLRLGDESAIGVVRAAMYSSYGEVRVLAIMMLGQIGDEKMQEALFDVIESGPAPVELRLAALASLAQVGLPAAIKDVLRLKAHVIEGSESPAAAVRAQSASTLGHMENARRRVRRNIAPTDPADVRAVFDDVFAIEKLLTLLNDESEQVRVAAADAILRIEG